MGGGNGTPCGGIWGGGIMDPPPSVTEEPLKDLGGGEQQHLRIPMVMGGGSEDPHSNIGGGGTEDPHDNRKGGGTGTPSTH